MITSLWSWARAAATAAASVALITTSAIPAGSTPTVVQTPVNVTRPIPTSPQMPPPPRPPVTPAPTVQPVFMDTFNGPAGAAPDSSRWALKLTDQWQPAAELQTYTADPLNAHTNGSGALLVTAVRTSSGWTSARLQSRQFYHYGHFEAHVAMPTETGAWGAFWLLGDDSQVGWPACGEIDVAELPMNPTDAGTVFAGTHEPGAAGGQVGSGPLVPSVHLTNPGAAHTYAIDWRAGQIVFSVDDTVTATLTRAGIEARGGVWVFDDRPQRLILNLAVGGWGGTPGPWASQTMTVDYVKVTA